MIVAEARVDSGASMSSIDSGFVDVLRLHPHASVTINSASVSVSGNVTVGFYWDNEYYELDFNVQIEHHCLLLFYLEGTG